MKDLFPIIVWNGILSFFVALSLVLLYTYFNIGVQWNLACYWVFAFIGCMSYDLIFKSKEPTEDDK